MEQDVLSMNTDKILDTKKTKTKRIFEIDFLRGFAICLMVMDHLFWNISNFIAYWFNTGVVHSNGILYNLPNDLGQVIPDWLFNYMTAGNWYIYWDVREAVRIVILFIFFVVSGISFTLSKNNLKRGGLILGGGILVSLVTFFLAYFGAISSSNFIPFGVLSCYGFIIILLYFVDLILRKIIYRKKVVSSVSKEEVDNNYYRISLITTFVLLFLFIFISSIIDLSSYSFTFRNIHDVKEVLLQIVSNIFGFANVSGDYFPIFPYINYFLIGIIIGKTVYKNKESLFKHDLDYFDFKRDQNNNNQAKLEYFNNLSSYKKFNYKFKNIMNKFFVKPICFIGRKTIWVYLAHIPIITLIHAILFFIAGFSLNL